MGLLWVFTSYLLLKTAFNTCIFIDISYFSLAKYRKVNCLFRTVIFPLFSICLMLTCPYYSTIVRYIPTIYSPFCWVICLGCLFFVLQKWIVFLFVTGTGTERTVFIIYQKNFPFSPEINQYIHKTKIVICKLSSTSGSSQTGRAEQTL
jgi:hypothetical protein